MLSLSQCRFVLHLYVLTFHFGYIYGQKSGSFDYQCQSGEAVSGIAYRKGISGSFEIRISCRSLANQGDPPLVSHAIF